MLLLSEKRQLLAVKHFACGAAFAILNAPCMQNSTLRGYILDLDAMIRVALEETNPNIHLAAIERYLGMVSNSCHVPSAQFAEKALNVLRSTR